MRRADTLDAAASALGISVTTLRTLTRRHKIPLPALEDGKRATRDAEPHPSRDAEPHPSRPAEEVPRG